MTERASTATVVFTDLVGSTALRARLGEERADALQGIHDRILTARVEANGGEVLKRMGDGMVAVFPAASDAATRSVGEGTPVHPEPRRARTRRPG